MDEELINVLKNAGLDENEINERVKQSKEPLLAGVVSTDPPALEKRAKKSFGFTLLKTCNMNCDFCIWDSYKRDNKMMVTPEFFEECIIKMEKEGYDFCSLIGGEVGVHPQFKEIINILVKHKMKFSLVTNCKEWERYKFIIENKKIKKYFDGLAVSLDGSEKIHDNFRGEGSYRKVLEALNYFKENKVNVSLKMVLRRDNFKDIMHVFKIAKQYKYNFEAFDVLRAPNHQLRECDLEELQKILEKNKKEIDDYKKKGKYNFHGLGDLNGNSQRIWMCPSFFSRELYFFPDGKVGYCCGGFVDDISIGNIKTDSVRELLEKRTQMSLYLIKNIYPILIQEVPFKLRDSCSLCRQLLGCKI